MNWASFLDSLMTPKFWTGWFVPSTIGPDAPNNTTSAILFSADTSFDWTFNTLPSAGGGILLFNASWDNGNASIFKHANLAMLSEGCIIGATGEIADSLEFTIPELPREFEDLTIPWSFEPWPIIPKITPPPPPRVNKAKPAIHLKLSHSITMERDMFVAQLVVTNGMTEYSIENLDIDISVLAEDGHVMDDQYADGPLWFQNPPVMENISDIDGSGNISPGETATVEWLIIPKADSGGTEGKQYVVRASGSFTVNGEEVFLNELTSDLEDTITVKPQPNLKLTYYLPEYVQAYEPFYLVLKAENTGHGTARSVIVDEAGNATLDLTHGYVDKNGTWWEGCVTTDFNGNIISHDPDCGIVHDARFTFEDKVVDKIGVSNHSMTTILGDIKSRESVITYWKLTCDKNGKFTDFNVSFTHSDELGGRATSLIESASTAYKQFVVTRINGENELCVYGDDGLLEIQTGVIHPVQKVQGRVVSEPSLDNPEMRIETDKTDGFILVDVLNPFGRSLGIKQIIRADGFILDPGSYWVEGNRLKIIDDPVTEYTVIFDVDEKATHTATVSLDKSLYTGLVDSAAIEVLDTDMDQTDGAGNDQIVVTVKSALDLQGETIILTEDSTEAGKFFGTIGFEENAVAGNNRVVVTVNGEFTASYVDEKNEKGESESISASAVWRLNDPPLPPVELSITELPSGYGYLVNWTGQGENVAGYRIHVGTESRTYTQVFDAQDLNSFDLSVLEGGYTYYIALTAYDQWGNEEGFSIELMVEIPLNNTPYLPALIAPDDGSVDNSVKISLSWQGGDPDTKDTVTYDVYLDVNSPPVSKVSEDQLNTSYKASGLSYGSIYYWKIVARDNHGVETEGDVWNFGTFAADGDTDGDGATNEEEVNANSDPFNSSSYPATTSVQLKKGFNLIAIPADVTGQPDLRDWLPAFGDNSEIEKVMVYDNQAGKFITLLPGDASNPSFMLEGGEGFIVYAKQDKEITFTSVLCSALNLKSGFNIVGFSCPVYGYSAYQLLNELGSENVSSIQRYSTEKGAFETAGFTQDGQVASVDFSIVAGEGYFIFMKQEVLGFSF